jgi:integrase
MTASGAREGGEVMTASLIALSGDPGADVHPRRRKAPNGAGSLYWDAKRARWNAKISIRREAQIRSFSALAFGSKRAALRAAREWLQERSVEGRRGVGVPRTGTRLEAAVEMYLDKLSGLTAKYKAQLRGRLTKLVRRFPGYSLEELRPVIYTFFDELRSQVSPKEFRHTRYCVRAFLDFCRWEELIGDRYINWKLIKNPPLQPRACRLFVDGSGDAVVDERLLLLQAAATGRADCSCHPPPEHQVALFSLQGFDALSPGEALGLAWSDVAADFSWVRIARTVEAIERLVEQTHGEMADVRREFESGRTAAKRGARIRTIYLSPDSREALRAWRTKAPTDAVLVFPSPTGGPERSQHLERLCVRLCALAGIRRHNPGDLRHTAITVALAHAKESEGITYANVSRWAGHSQVSTTTDNYLHMLPNGPRSVAAWSELQRAPLARVG